VENGDYAKNSVENLGCTSRLALTLIRFSRLHHRKRICTYRSANRDELRNVETALAKFEFRDEGLPLSNPLPKLCLRNASVFSSLHEQFDYPQVKIRTK